MNPEAGKWIITGMLLVRSHCWGAATTKPAWESRPHQQASLDMVQMMLMADNDDVMPLELEHPIKSWTSREGIKNPVMENFHQGGGRGSTPLFCKKMAQKQCCWRTKLLVGNMGTVGFKYPHYTFRNIC